MMRLVQFETQDRIRLNGLLADAGSELTVVHIHGRGGNFYENGFVRRMYSEYPKQGINFLSFNNRGHSSYVEAYINGEVGYIGSAIEEFQECLLDLEAAIEFAHTIGRRVVLQGHSLGCEKIMYYGQKRDPLLPLVMLSPCDGYRLQTVYRAPESVEEQILRLRSSYSLEGLELLPPEEYGIRCGGVSYYVPITAKALVSLLTGPAFRVLRRDLKWNLPLLKNRCYVYLGGADALQIDGAEALRGVLYERFADVHVEIFEDGDHHMHGVTREVLDSIIRWITHIAGDMDNH